MYNNGMGKNYFNAMDRDYSTASLENYGLRGSYSVGGPVGSENAAHYVNNIDPEKEIPEIGLGVEHIGVSSNPMQDQGQAVRQRIFQGAKQVEIGFMGTGKGSQQSRTPESYGKNERINIRELAKVNEVNLTTHAAFGLGSLAGYGNQIYPSGDLQEGFNETNRQKALQEIQKAVDFAADVSNGGAVVVHAVEHMRPIYEAGHDDKYKGKFTYYGEEEKILSPLVDPKRGKVIGGEVLKEPRIEIQYEETKNGKSWKTIDGSEEINKREFYRNIQPRIIRQEIAKQIYNSDGKNNYSEEELERRLKQEERQNPVLKKDIEEKILEKQREQLDRIEKLKPLIKKDDEDSKKDDEDSDKNPIIETKKIEWKELLEEAKKYGIRPEEYWLTNHVREQVLEAKTSKDFLIEKDREILELHRELHKEEDEERTKKILRNKAEDELNKKIEKLDQEKMNLKVDGVLNPIHESDIIRERRKYETLKKELRENGVIAEQYEKYKERLPSVIQQISSQRQSKEDRLKLLEFRNIKEYTDEKVAESLAESAIYATQREMIEKDNNQESRDRLKKPLFIAYEPVWPEQYGGHPDEIVDMIKEARRQFVSITTGKNKKYQGHPMYGKFDEKEAEKEAKRRIKGVWDTGHVNIWRKYMKDMSQEEFKEWYVDKAKKWMEEDVMGHIHVTENLGWEDEHLPPGEGNTPIREVIQLVKEKAMSEDPEEKIAIITEPAHHDFKAMLGSWKLFGSSIYGANQKFKNSWLDIESGYFGRAYGSNQIYSGLNTGERDPQSWSNVPLN